LKNVDFPEELEKKAACDSINHRLMVIFLDANSLHQIFGLASSIT
jgi:hypothetical protein